MTLCPTPGTTSNFPCGNWSTTISAFATGVRRSKPPSIATIGTFGSGPGPSGELPAGEGHCSQKYAVPMRAAQFPNGPRLPGGSFVTAASIAARRSDGAVAGDHGNWPSAQFVAAFRPKLSSSAVSLFAPKSRSKTLSKGRMLPPSAECTAAGASDASPGVRSASTIMFRNSSPFMRMAFALPFVPMIVPWIGFASSRFASLPTSPA